MITTGNKFVRALLVIFAFLFTTSASYAFHWGQGPFGGENGGRIHNVLTAPAHHWGQGPFAGRNGKAIHDSIMRGEKAIGDAATFVWNAAKRPFVETWKFFAGLGDRIHKAIDAAAAWLTNLVWLAIKWLSVGFGAAVAFAVCLAMGLARLFFHNRRVAHAVA